MRTASRIACGIIFVAAAVLVLLNVFGVITLTINVGILVALAALAIIAVYSAFHLFWAGFFFIAATIIVIMNSQGLVFDLNGQGIGGLYIAAALLTVAFHLFVRKSIFGLSLGSRTDANFGSTAKYFDDELSAESLECNFGSIEAYFENAKPKDNQAKVHLECNFGSIELYVPKAWKVIDHTRTSFGSVNEKNHPVVTEKSPVLTLEGECNFGSITIIYL